MTKDAGETNGTRAEDDEFRAALARLVQQLTQEDLALKRGNPLLPRLDAHFGAPADELPVVAQTVDPHRWADTDIALAAIAQRDPHGQLVGIGGGDQRHHSSLSDLMEQAQWGRFRQGQVDRLNVATGPDSERATVGFGLHLFSFDGLPVAVLQRAANPQYGAESRLEVLAPTPEVAADLLAEVREQAMDHSILRGQVLTFAGNPYERTAAGITFMRRPEVPADQVVLPEGTLDEVHAHVVGLAEHREQLRERGQHLKRGILLYGPPGTGKTHSVRHLIGAQPDTTVILLTGMQMGQVAAAAQIARAHQPAMVVLEDCDLIAEDRDHDHFGGGPSPLLFTLLDAMDGLDQDADVVFLLTTNRVEALEKALAQRPGRVDLAVEIPPSGRGLPAPPDRAVRRPGRLLRTGRGRGRQGFGRQCCVVRQGARTTRGAACRSGRPRPGRRRPARGERGTAGRRRHADTRPVGVSPCRASGGTPSGRRRWPDLVSVDVSDAMISAVGLRKSFGAFEAVKGIDVEVRRGEAFGFLGPNGAGKSSTMRMIASVSPVSAGDLRILGMDPSTDGPAIRSRIGVCPQEDTLDNELNVFDNLFIYGRYFGIDKATCRERAQELLEFAVLTDKARSKVEELSGGMKRRLTIARSLINRPELLLLDEPTTGLDPQARHVLWDQLFRLKQAGVTLVVTTHYMDEAEQLCDRLVVMDKGVIAAEGSPRELIDRFSTREVAELRFGVGEHEALAGKVEDLGDRVEVLPDRLLVYADDGEAVLAQVHDRGLQPVAALVRRSSLEDVFLRLTGRSLVD